MTDTTSVPTEPLVEHIVAEALEVGEIDHEPSPPEGAEDLEYSWRDIDDWDVDIDGDVIVLTGATTAHYSIQTARAVTSAPPSKCHPAEFRQEDLPLLVEIRADWTAQHGLGAYTISAEVA